MKHGIKVGGNVSETHVDAMADGIAKILEAGYAAHADQDTVRAALEALSRSTRVEHVTVANCSIVQEA